MSYIYRNFDGPLYIVPAKTFYNPERILRLGVELPLPEIYFAAHFPFYPFLIRLFAPFFGYLKAMIFVNLFSTIFLTCFFYFMIKRLKISKKPLLLSVIFLFIPKFLVVRSIGAPESLFMLFILLSLFFFEQKKFFLSGFFGGLATMTKSPGILLFFAYIFSILEIYLKTKKINWQWLGVFLIPLGLLIVFSLYWFQYQDFFAYFHSSDRLFLFFPFSVFNFQAKWVGTAWLEDIVLYFFLYGITVIYLLKHRYQCFFYFSLIFFLSLITVKHRDIPRYSLPLWPMTLITFEKFFTEKRFLIVFILLLPAVYFFAWNFIIYNIMPVSNWAPYL